MPDQNKPAKNLGGRPLFDGKPEWEIVAKLETVWAMRGSDVQAALFAGISRTALDRYLNKNPKVAERKELLREMPVLKALKTVQDSLDDPDRAQWYLERVMPNEFGKKAEGQLPPGPTINIFGDVKFQQLVSNFEDQFKQMLMTKLNPTYVEAQSVPTIHQADSGPVADAGVSDHAGEIPERTVAAGGGDNRHGGPEGGLPEANDDTSPAEEVDQPGEEHQTAGEVETDETVRLDESAEAPTPELVVPPLRPQTGEANNH